MKRILFTLLFAILALGAMAQDAKQLININQASFRPVQTDVLTGVNIDKIAKDRSQRDCARIKIHVNRMTREEIDELQVVIAGGNVALTKKITAYEGNGLIVEMTAKPQARFHLHHDKYGDSNQVIVDLEGNKEYFLDAQLDLLLSIVVATNVSGADIYIDGAYKGRSDANYMLTVEDVTPGMHKISIKHGAASVERSVDVNSSNISFRIDVNTQTSQPQYVIFQVNPPHSVVMIDGEVQTTQEGFVQALLQNGTYSYRVMAKGYREKSGSFTVSGEKVQIPVELTADAATVTITSAAGSEIWVNNELKGPSPWKGVLLSGTYIFEARKAGHRTTILSQTITATSTEQHFTLETPAPIEGMLNITSVPAVADVYVDGKNVGQTPMMSKWMTGSYTIELRRSGYAPKMEQVKVVEGKTATVNITLTKLQTTSTSASSSFLSATNEVAKALSVADMNNTTTCGPYKVGDYFHENGRKGVVFEVATDGMSGKILSLEEGEYLQYAKSDGEVRRWLGATDKKNGANNMAKVKKRPNWKTNYPAFAWCAEQGEGWYLPAIEELKVFTLNKSVRDAVNATLKEQGKPLTFGNYSDYWSSTELYKQSNNESKDFYAQYVSLRYDKNYSNVKYAKYYSRAVSLFQSDPQAQYIVRQIEEKRAQELRRRTIEYSCESKIYENFGAELLSHTFKDGKGVITFKNNVTEFGSAFSGTKITSITIPDGVESIADRAFYRCGLLESITIPDGVKIIGEEALSYCKKLKTAYIPESVISMGKKVFFCCNDLESVTLPKCVASVECLGSFFYDCSRLKEFKGPLATADGRVLAANGVLYRVATAGLSSYTIPNNITTIGPWAFGYDKNITVVTIPEYVAEIGSDAFWSCTSLKSVYCKNPIPPVMLDEDVFRYWDRRTDKPIGCTIYVPAQSVKAYKKAPYWKNYKKYIKPMTE